MKWMAPGDPFNRQPSSLNSAMFGDGLVAIMGAGWMKTAARWKSLRYEFLIKSN